MLCLRSRRVDLVRDHMDPNQDLGQRRPSRPPPRTFNTRQYKQTVAQCPLCVDPMDVRVCVICVLSHSLSRLVRARDHGRSQRKRGRGIFLSHPPVHSFKKEPRFRLCRCHLAWRRVKIHRQPRSLVRSQQPPPSRRGSPARPRWPLSQQKRRPATAPLFKNTADAFWNRFVPNFR